MRKFLAAITLVLAGTACALVGGCAKKTANVSFEVNGGVAIVDYVAKKGEEYTLPIPERSGYEFGGWYVSSDCTGDAVTSVVISGNVTYYAKWTQLHAVTFELNGGSLSTQTVVMLKEGENVYANVSSIVPVKSGFIFGGWYVGNKELSQTATMPAGGMTLTAKYKVEYTVEVYKQNIAGTEYVKDDEAAYKGADFAGVSVSPSVRLTGFKKVSNPQEVTALTLTEVAAQNVLKYYYDREEYSVNFVSNYPDGSAQEMRTLTAIYGTEVELPVDFVCEGYCLMGYSSTQSGEVEYAVNYIDSVLYGGENTDAESAKFAPERNTALYAVWSKGYTDMFGGNDYIFLPDDSADVIYLARGSVFFKGKYFPITRSFTFNGIIDGMLNGDGTFVYKNDLRAKTYKLYLPDGSISSTTSINFNAYNMITYTCDGKESKGTYYEKDDIIYAHFTSGELSGQDMAVKLGNPNQSGGDQYIFRIRNEEEIALGEISRLVMTRNGVGVYRYFGVKLNGFGVATITTESGDITYGYTYDGQNKEITFLGSYDNVLSVARLMEVDSQKGYMIYNEDLDITIEQDGGSLTLDGICSATYVRGGETIEGNFVNYGSTVMGSLNIEFISENGIYNLLLKPSTDQVTIVDGSTETVTTYSFEEKPDTYAEYLYTDASNIYYTCIAVDDEETGKANVYQRNNGKFIKVAEGVCTYDESTSTYNFVKGDFEPEEDIYVVINLAVLKSFTFGVGIKEVGGESYPVAYIRAYTTESGNAETAVVYTGENGTKLSLIAGFAVYENSTSSSSGVYTLDGNLLYIDALDGIYMRLNVQDKTFVALDFRPYEAVELKADGTADIREFISFDGTADGATYVHLVNGASVSVVGKFKKTDKPTSFGSTVYEFNSDTLRFNFIQTSSEYVNYFSIFNANLNGEYESEKEGVLALDGYSNKAYFNSIKAGVKYEGAYTVVGEKTVRLQTANGGEYYFDLTDSGFTVRGKEYGTYTVVENSIAGDMSVLLDGYGKAVITRKGAVVDDNATYTVTDSLYTVLFTDDGAVKTLVGISSTVSGVNKAFVIVHDELAQIYVDSADYSIIILDNAGKAVKYDRYGARSNGSYTLITDTLMYFNSGVESTSCIYEYDAQKHTATAVKRNRSVGYYTSDLESLIFSSDGFAVFGGTTRYYYTTDVDGEVILFRLAEEGENVTVNGYGFVEERLGAFDAVKTYNGKTYYQTSGYALTFKRGETGEGINNYPIQLAAQGGNANQQKYPIMDVEFMPDGKREFSVRGILHIENEERFVPEYFDCYVVRKEVDGELQTYIAINGYRFDIELEFIGEDDNGNILSTYVVTDLHYVTELGSYKYLYDMYTFTMYDAMLGTNYLDGLEDTYGAITISYAYDETGKVIGAVYDENGDLALVKDADGKATDEYVDDGGRVTVKFLSDSGAYDANGELLEIDGASYSVSDELFVVDFKGNDGYDYRLRFMAQQISNTGIYGYRVYSLTRVQDLTVGDFVVGVERVITTELQDVDKGDVLFISLEEGENAVAFDYAVIRQDGSVVGIVRTVEDDKISSSVYYTISFTEKNGDVVGGVGESVAAYESAAVVKEEVTAVYDESGTCYADMSDGGVKAIYTNGRLYMANGCTYDEASGTYTVTTYSAVYTVKISDGKAVIALA